MAARVVWKGAITFGLVHIPVTLRAASRRQDLDFDWLDKRDMAPVGYQRINKRTGQPIEGEHIVKGYRYEGDEYVLMSDEDFRQANPEATQTVDILAFVDAAEVSPSYFETPYYLEAGKRGEKGYALLREVMKRSGRIGIATVVMHTKQHLAAVRVEGPVLVLNTMRFADEMLSADDLYVPQEDLEAVGVGARELEMAQQLVDQMTEPWRPEQYRDTYREDLLARIEAKIRAGQTHTLAAVGEEETPARRGAEVIDLMAALRQSVQRAQRDTSAGDGRGTVKPMRGDGKTSSAPSPAPATRSARGKPQEEEATAGNRTRKTPASRKPTAPTSGRAAAVPKPAPTTRRKRA